MWTFIMLPNCVVHVIMYIYYLCACLGPKMQKIITPWKKYMTRLQLVRYFILIYSHYVSLFTVLLFTRCVVRRFNKFLATVSR